MASVLNDSLLSEGSPRPITTKQIVKGKVDVLRSSALQKTGLETSDQKAKRLERERRNNYIKLMGHAVVGSLSFILGGLGIFLDTLILQKVAMIFPMVLGPLMFMQRRKIVAWGNVRQLINILRDEVNNFTRQNILLEREQTRLERSVVRLKGTEQKLRNSVETQGADINYFITLMKENQQTLIQIHKIQQQRIMQDLIKALMRADNKNPDFYIDMQEMEELILRMRHLHGVNFDEDRFRRLVQEKSVGVGKRRKTSVDACLEIARTMLESKYTPKFYGRNQIKQHDSVRELSQELSSATPEAKIPDPIDLSENTSIDISSVAMTTTTAGISKESKKSKLGKSLMKLKKKKNNDPQAPGSESPMPPMEIDNVDGVLC